MLITVETKDGPKQVRVCDHCRTVCCTTQYCSSRCYHQAIDRADHLRKEERESK